MSGRPGISVVVPTRDRPASMRRCLEALAAQQGASGPLEVIISDDGGSRPLDDLIAPFAADLNLRLVRGAGGGPAAARNRGAAEATSRHLVFIDDDCRPRVDWHARLERRIAQHPDAMIAGDVVNGLPGNVFSSATQAVVSASAEQYARRRHAASLFTTSNLVVPAAGFRRLGGFDTSFPLAAGEDYDLCERWHAAGGTTLRAAEAIVVHEHPLDLRAFIRQHRAYGRGLLRLRRKIAAREGGRPRPQAPSFYLRLVTWPLINERGARALVIAALVVLSQLATAVGAAEGRLGEAQA